MKYFNHSPKIEKLSFSNGNAIICAVDETSDNDTLEETSSKSKIKTRKSHLTYWQRLLIFLNLQQGSTSQFFLVQMNVFIIIIVSFLIRLLIMRSIIVSIISWPWRIVRRGWSLICWRIVTWFVTWLITRLVTGFRRRRTIMIIVIVNMNYFASVMPFGWSSI